MVELENYGRTQMAERSVINHHDYFTKGRLVTSPAVNITESDILTADGENIPYDYLVVTTGHGYPSPRTKLDKISYYQGGDSGPPRSKVLLEYISPGASKKALNWLTSKKVEVILGQSVELGGSSDGTYQTSGGETIIADCHFLCTGVPLGSSWISETFLKKSMDDRGRLAVDKHLRVTGHSNIFALGDITDIPEIKQGYLAKQDAAVAAKNLKKLIGGPDESVVSTYKANYLWLICGVAWEERGIGTVPIRVLDRLYSRHSEIQRLGRWKVEKRAGTSSVKQKPHWPCHI